MKLYGLWSDANVEIVQQHVNDWLNGTVSLILITDIEYFYLHEYPISDVYEIDLETGKVSTI